MSPISPNPLNVRANYALKLPGGHRRAGQPSLAALFPVAGAAYICSSLSCGRPARSLMLIR
jgi:hypothetical protein